MACPLCLTNPPEVLTAQAFTTYEDCPQILVSDIRMPDGSVIDLLESVTYLARAAAPKTLAKPSD